jgi:hypothetical protein
MADLVLGVISSKQKTAVILQEDPDMNPHVSDHTKAVASIGSIGAAEADYPYLAEARKVQSRIQFKIGRIFTSVEKCFEELTL